MDVGGWQFGATGLQRPRKKARADAAGGEALGGAVVVLTEGAKTAALTLEGQLWVWGYNFGQLGLADTDCRRAPMLVGGVAQVGGLSAAPDSRRGEGHATHAQQACQVCQ